MASPTSPRVSAVVFDLGGVLIDWNPRYLYRTLFDDDEAMEEFLATVTTPEWNKAQDAGRPWPETLGDAVAPTVAVLDELRATGVRLFALSNWSGETFPVARPRYPFL